MKAIIAVLGLLAVTGWAREVQVGDDLIQVTAILGEPRGVIQTPAYQLLTFDRGRIELRAGRVTLVDLVSQEEADLLRAERLAQEVEARRFAEARRQELAALNRLEAEMARRQLAAEQEQRIRELEARVALAEQRAAEPRLARSVVYYEPLYRPSYVVSTGARWTRSSCAPKPVCATPVKREPRRSGITVTIANGPELCRSALTYSGSTSVGRWSSAAFH